MADGWPLADLPSKAVGHPGDRSAAALRVDPYYDGVWSVGSSASWLTLKLHRQQLRSGGSIIPSSHLDADTERAMRRLEVGQTWDQMLRLLAALGSYRTLTAEQLACLSGVESVASGRSPIMGDLFSLGLVDIGEYRVPLASTFRRGRGGGILYRPSSTRAFEKLIQPRCTFEEWCSVTGGLEWSSNSQYDRHNILTSEAVLRALEHVPQIVGSLGDRFSDAGLLCYESIGRPAPKQSRNHRADATLLRGDGMRIIIELTASTGGSSFARKVSNWAAAFGGRPSAVDGSESEASREEKRAATYDECGAVLLLLVAPRDVRHASSAHSAATVARSEIRRAISAHPLHVRRQLEQRMLVAEWEDWFPSSRTASRAFLGLEAERLQAAEWHRARLADESSLPTPANGELRSGLANLAGLRQTPAWMLPGLPQAPETWRHGAARSPVQTGEPYTGELVSGLDLEALLPERMLPAGPRGVSRKSGPKTPPKMAADGRGGGRHGS